jgi:peptide/nickel transport system substrate-binding protein
MFRSLLVVLVGVSLLAGCATPPTPRADEGPAAASAPAAQPAPVRAITMGVRYELISGQSKALNNSSSAIQKRLFNASLAMMDGKGVIHPYLAETLPQLNADSWQVFPDGRMETTYRLRPDLTWHDGQPLTADDFVFAYSIYSSKAGLQIFQPTPQDRMSDVLAPDPRTVVIRWRSPYPDAGALRFDHFDPLPRHILEPIASLDDGEALGGLPFWTRDYISSGPYKLTRWEPGTLLELVAFDGHALGRPKIDRITVRIIPDENTMLSNVRSGYVDVALDNSLRFEHAQVLKQEWGPTNKGTVLLEAIQARTASFQNRPDLVTPRALLDQRVRRALAHAVDKQGLVDGLFEGEPIPVVDTIIPPSMPYFSDLDRAIVKYPFDLRRSEQYLTEAGFRRGADGIWAGGDAGERMSFALMSGSGTRNERERAVIADGWRRAGFEVAETQLSASQTTDAQVRATAPGVLTSGASVGETSLARYASAQIGTTANRWRGQNYSAWSNPEYDRLYEQFNSTLDRPERDKQVIQMLRLVTDDVVNLVFYHDPGVTAFTSNLTGPQVGPPDSLLGWNVYEWELR